MRLPRELRALPALAETRAEALLRDLPNRQVWRIRLDGKTAYLKHFLGPDRDRQATGAHNRLCAAGRILGQDRNAAVRPLLLIAPAGVLVTEPASGVPLGQALQRAENRAALIGRAGDWLARLASGSRETGSFGPRYWIDGLQRRLDSVQRDWLDAALVDRHLAIMREEGASLRQARVERACLHGDLTGDNLFHDAANDRMTAIDMQDWGPIAVARDVARLLVWLESRRIEDGSSHMDGISAGDYRAMSGTPGLLGDDQMPLLRFMIGDLLLAYYLDSDHQPTRRAALARAMRAWAQPSSASAAR